MHFRPATAADAATIARLHAESWRRTYRGMLSDAYLDGAVMADRLALWEERLLAPAANQYVVVAQDGEELAGFACAYGASEERWGTLLDNLHVAHVHQGRGLGARLMADVAAWSSAHFAGQGLFLWVLEGNLQARRFYERLGGACVGDEIWNPPGGGAVKVLRFAWPHTEGVGDRGQGTGGGSVHP